MYDVQMNLWAFKNTNFAILPLTNRQITYIADS